MRTRQKKHVILPKEETLEMLNYKTPVLLNNNLNIAGYPSEVQSAFLLL